MRRAAALLTLLLFAFSAYAGLLSIAGGRGSPPVGGGSLPFDDPEQDGLATPEQISIIAPVTGSIDAQASTTTRYRTTSGPGAWVVGHPAFRVATWVDDPDVGAVIDAFAWPLIDLTPGTSYDVELCVTDGEQDCREFTTSTRALPASCGAANKTADTAGEIASEFASLNAGDVLEIADGNYTVNGLTLNRSGTSGSLICIRGESRAGTILTDTAGTIIALQEANHVIFENFTMVGSAADSGTDASSAAFTQSDNDYDSVNITVREITATGIDRFVDFAGEAYGTLVYDTTSAGNNLWSTSPTDFLDTNTTWNDAGIKIPGDGNAAFNNTISEMGDTFSLASHAGAGNVAASYNTHFYRNEIRNSTDDPLEADHGIRNLSFYDNRITNTINCVSLDPLYGGPFLYARNICINPARVGVLKWNGVSGGHFFYSNTIIGTVSAIGADDDVANWYQPVTGYNDNYGFRNNLWVYRGAGQSVWREDGGSNVVDWTNNAWYPNRQIQFDGTYANLAAAQASIPSTTRRDSSTLAERTWGSRDSGIPRPTSGP